MEDKKQIIVDNLIFLRKSHKFTQLELATKLNYTDKAISKWERGESLPDTLVMQELAEIYGVTIDYFYHKHSSHTLDSVKQMNYANKNRVTISLLLISFVLLVATTIFVYVGMNTSSFKGLWKIFVLSVPVSLFSLICFNKYCKVKDNTGILSSLFLWSLFASIYIAFLEYNIYLVFVIAVPLQIIILLWKRLESINK